MITVLTVIVAFTRDQIHIWMELRWTGRPSRLEGDTPWVQSHVSGS